MMADDDDESEDEKMEVAVCSVSVVWRAVVGVVILTYSVP